MKRVFILGLLLVAGADAVAQRIITDSYTCRYVISDAETIGQAEVNAVRKAQTEMIAANFGTVVGETTALTISESVSSIIYGDVDAKGVWLQDTSAPVIKKLVVNGHFVLEVTVSGKIREIVSAPVDLKCSVLKNGTEMKYASTEFRHGDRLYLSFKTPVDGYLAVYLGNRETVSCLFPYSGLPADIMRVVADEEYILFSRAESGNLDPFSVQEYSLGCSLGKEMEMDRLYVIFSPDEFTKANDNADGRLRSLPYEEFHAWLSKIRRLDARMNLKYFDITIRRK